MLPAYRRRPATTGTRQLLVALLVAHLGACSPTSTDPTTGTETGEDGADGNDGDSDGNNEALLTYQPCSDETKVGDFAVVLAKEYTGVQGRVYDGVVPGNIPAQTAEVGDCRLMKRRSLFCDPACTAGETCGSDGTCITYPTAQSVGTVKVTGLLQDVTMEAQAPGYFYTNPGSLPHPGFAAGADIALETSGGVYDAFSLKGFGIDELEVDADPAIVVDGQGAVTVTWEPSALEGPVAIHVELNINNHGSSMNWIECDVEDTGSVTIDASLMTDLYGLGRSGFPTLILSRRSADSVTIEPGCVELLVVSDGEIPVQVPGLVSCNFDDDCEAGQTCQVDLTCG